MGSGIMLGYFKWVGNFAKGSGIKKMAMIRVVQQKHGGKICNTLWWFCLRTSRFGKGGLSCSLKLTIKSVDHAKFQGAQVVINYSS